MIFGPSGWPSRWAVKAGSALAILALGLIFLGTVGRVILFIVVAAILIITVSRRVTSVDPDEEFRNSRPDE